MGKVGTSEKVGKSEGGEKEKGVRSVYKVLKFSLRDFRVRREWKFLSIRIYLIFGFYYLLSSEMSYRHQHSSYSDFIDF